MSDKATTPCQLCPGSIFALGLAAVKMSYSRHMNTPGPACSYDALLYNSSLLSVNRNPGSIQSRAAAGARYVMLVDDIFGTVIFCSETSRIQAGLGFVASLHNP